jgi:hypothetical protein
MYDDVELRATEGYSKSEYKVITDEVRHQFLLAKLKNDLLFETDNAFHAMELCGINNTKAILGGFVQAGGPAGFFFTWLGVFPTMEDLDQHAKSWGAITSEEEINNLKPSEILHYWSK